MGIEKLTQEQLKAWNDAKKDGQITPEERKKLEAAGINEAILKELVKEHSGGNSDGYISSNNGTMHLVKEMESPKTEESSFIGTLFVIGGLILAALGFTSCSEDGPNNMELPDNNIDASTEVKVSINNITKNSDDTEILAAILAELKKIGGNISDSLDTIINKLTEIGKTTAQIQAYLLQAGVKFDELLAKFDGFDAKALMDLLKGIKDDTETTNTILTTLANNDEETKQLLNRILVAVNKGNELSNENNKLLTSILAKLGKLDENDTSALDLLKFILDKLTVSVEQNAKMDEKTHQLMQVIIEKLDKIVATVNNVGTATHEYLKTFINIISELTKEQRMFGEKIVSLLTDFKAENQKELAAIQEQLAALLAKIDTLTEDQRMFGEKIVSMMAMMDENAKAGLAELLAKIDTLDKNQQDSAQKILTAIAMMDKNIQGGFVAVLAKMDSMSKEQRTFVEKLCAQIDKLDKNTQIGFTNVLNAIAKGNVTDDKILAKLQEILDKIGSMDEFNKQALAAVLNAISGLGDKSDAILDAVLNGDKFTSEQLQAIIKNQEKQTAQFDELRKLVMENNEIAQGTLDAVNNLSAQNNEDHATIIDLLTKLANKPESDMSVMKDIKAILKEIQTNTAGNWDTSLRIEDKLNIIGQTINVILQTQTNLGEDVKAHLLAILAKIPEGCNCTHETIDLSDIITKLDELIESVEEGRNDPKHEGILDDLENQLG